MRAVAVVRAGEPPRLVELRVPEPGPGQVLVRVRAAGVNPYDGKRAGGLYGELPLPFVPGVDGAGEVVAPDVETNGFAVGDRIFGRLGDGGHGTFAEFTVARTDGVVARIPKALDFDTVAATPVAGLTALGVLRSLSLSPGDRLFVIGATGGVGSFLIQLAARTGVVVVATARPEFAERMSSFGATATVDHTSDVPVRDQLAAVEPAGFHALVDLAGARALVEAVAPLLNAGGTAVSTAGGVDPDKLAERGITGIQYRGRSTAAQLEELAAMIDRGDLVVPVDRRLPLSDGPRALEESRGNHMHGKTILRIDAEVERGAGEG